MLPLTILEMCEVLERLPTAPTECEVGVTVTVTIDLLDRVS